jgi:hydroxylamine reductase
MFCFQCEQTMGGRGCTIQGVCGKNEPTAKEQDKLTAELINLAAAATAAGRITDEAARITVDGLFMCVSNVDYDEKTVEALKNEVIKERQETEASAKIQITPYKTENLFAGENADDASLRGALLFGLRGMAAYAHHARVLSLRDKNVDEWFFKGLNSFNQKLSVEERLNLIMEFGKINLRCMEILDEANTKTYGTPEPTKVTTNIEKGPFVIITGHDLKDLKMLLEQTEGKGVNVYTHGEMLPAHAYPELKKYKQLKGNFGTAWQNQQKEFIDVPAPVLWTTNCIMIPHASYKDRVYTTSVVAFPGTKHIEADAKGHKDFTSLIEHAKKLGGYKENKHMTGINGGGVLTVGFGRGTVLGAADKVMSAVKSGAVKHFFLVGGCDGAKPGRNYYTEFVRKTPKDSIILTLACGKYRFNDLDLGGIGGLPRIMDMGQCNDAYGAIQVAIALSKAFNVPINDLPLTLVLSWYEQKAVCVLLTLLSLGLTNIYLGPTMPAFLSDNVLKILTDKFKLHPITTPEEDMKKMLGK